MKNWEPEKCDDFKAGQKVFDDLTGKIDVIKSIHKDENGNIGIFLSDESWLGGGRFPWEVSQIEEKTCATI